MRPAAAPSARLEQPAGAGRDRPARRAADGSDPHLGLGPLPVDLVELIVGLRVASRAHLAHWQAAERIRLLRAHPALGEAARTVPLYQLRTFLQPPAEPRPAEGELWIDGRGELWYQRAAGGAPPRRLEVRASRYGPPARVRHAVHNDEAVLVILASGAVLRLVGHGALRDIVLQGPLAHLGEPGEPGEPGVLGRLMPGSSAVAYVLTARGRLWVLPEDQEREEEGGGAPPPGLLAAAGAAGGGPARVSTLWSGEAAPPFVGFSIDESLFEEEVAAVRRASLCAVDADGRLYAAGAPFGQLLQRLPPTPAPVRSLLACASCCFRFARETPSRLPRVSRGPADEHGGAGPLALLVDGSVWALAAQQRLPLLGGINAMRRTRLGRVLFKGPRVPPVELQPHMLWTIRDWLDTEAGAGEAGAGEAGAGEAGAAGEAGEAGEEGEDRSSARAIEHGAAIGDDGALMVVGTGPGSLTPGHPDMEQLSGPLDPLFSKILEFEWHIAEPADLGGERAAEVWVGQAWTVARTAEGSLWVWGRAARGAFAGVGLGLQSKRMVSAPTRVTHLADGEPAPDFTAAAAGETRGVLCLCAQDAQGRLYAADRRSAGAPERLLARVEGAPRVRARVLLADPEPLALFEDGRVWSVEAGRLLPCGGVEHMSAPPQWYSPSYSEARPVRLRRADGRVLEVDSTALWSATTHRLARWH